MWQDSVVKNYLTTASDGKKYDVTFYSLSMNLAIGFRERSTRLMLPEFEIKGLIKIKLQILGLQLGSITEPIGAVALFFVDVPNYLKIFFHYR